MYVHEKYCQLIPASLIAMLTTTFHNNVSKVSKIEPFSTKYLENKTVFKTSIACFYVDDTGYFSGWFKPYCNKTK